MGCKYRCSGIPNYLRDYIFGDSSIPVSATGGIITTSGPYTIHTFNSSGEFTVLMGGRVEYFGIGGGGGGGAVGGGGGAGGLQTGVADVSIGAYAITVGAGGAGGASGAGNNGVQGSNSVIAGIATAIGGGYGGGNAFAGGNGGCSGGGAAVSMPPGTPSQGYTGGSGYSAVHYSTGGGGGIGGAGATPANGNFGGAGGKGLYSNISGSFTPYGGGGGGSVRNSGVAGGAGGVGGGGNGSISAVGVNGTANTGGGGGGGSYDGTFHGGGNGGSGIVIIRYLTAGGTIGRSKVSSNIISDGNSYTLTSSTPYPDIIIATSPFSSNGSLMTNYGVAGQTTPQMLADQASQVLTQYKLNWQNIILFQEGGNDIYFNGSASDAIDNLTDYCEAAHAAGFKIIVSTLIHRNNSLTAFGDNLSQYNAKIDAFNALLIALTGVYDGLIRPDLESIFATYGSAGYQGDGVHPSDIGSSKYAELYTNGINALVW